MDIDLGVLRLMEREREIPFEELVQIIEQAILTAYLKHTGNTAKSGARAELDRKTGHVYVYLPERDENGEIIGEEIDSPDDFGRIAAFAAKQVINQRLRDIGDDRVLGEFRGREGDIVAGVIRRERTPGWCTSTSDRSRRSCPRRAGAGRGISPRRPHPRLRHERQQGAEGPVDHGEPHASGPRPQAVRARGARRSPAASGSRSPPSPAGRGRPPHQDCRARDAARSQREGRLHRRARPARPRRHRRAARREDRHRRLERRPADVRRECPLAREGDERVVVGRREPSRPSAPSCPTTSSRSRSARRARTPASPRSSRALASTSSPTR